MAPLTVLFFNIERSVLSELSPEILLDEGHLMCDTYKNLRGAKQIKRKENLDVRI